MGDSQDRVKELNRRLKGFESKNKTTLKLMRQLKEKAAALGDNIEAEQRQHAQAVNRMNKREQMLNDLSNKVEEGNRNRLRLEELANNLQEDVTTGEQRMAQAEESAATNLVKYRQMQDALEVAQEKADEAENKLHKQRAQHRHSDS